MIKRGTAWHAARWNPAGSLVLVLGDGELGHQLVVGLVAGGVGSIRVLGDGFDDLGSTIGRPARSRVHFEGSLARLGTVGQISRVALDVDVIVTANATESFGLLTNEVAFHLGVPMVGAEIDEVGPLLWSVDPAGSPCLACRRDPRGLARTGTERRGPLLQVLAGHAGLEVLGYLGSPRGPRSAGAVTRLDDAGRLVAPRSWGRALDCPVCGMAVACHT